MAITAFLINGDELHFAEDHDSVTANDVKVAAAIKMDVDVFAPDMVVINETTGEASTDDRACVTKKAGESAVLRVLVNALERDDAYWRSAMIAHAMSLDSARATLALAHMSDADRDACLVYACTHGLVPVARFLVLEGGANPNHEDPYGRFRYSCLRLAVDGEHAELVQVLLEAGAAPRDARAHLTHSCLLSASFRGNERIVELLLAAEPRPTAEHLGSALLSAAEYGHTAVVSHLRRAF